jgi:hypothetical protein
MEFKTILNTIKLMPLERYLTKKGWQIQDSKMVNLREIKKSIGGEEVILYIPKKESLLDYSSLLNGLIRSISQIEERDYQEISDELIYYCRVCVG